MALRFLLTLFILFSLVPAPGLARPAIRFPSIAGEVLERLPSGYAALAPRPPGKAPRAPLEQAVALLTAAARTGDARLARRADLLLARLPAQDSPDARRARAFAAQHRHDFDAATRLLDALVAADPRDADARFSRAQVAIVQGHLDRARADCGTLALSLDASLGTVCLAAIAQRTGNYEQAARLAGLWLGRVGGDAGMRRYVTVLRAETASRAGDADAERWFRAALALDPGDARTQAAYARFLLSRGQPARALSLLQAAGDSDTLQLQRVLAATALQRADAAALAEAQWRRYRLARALGTVPELRDEAELLLSVRHDPAAALALAQENFGQQKDYEDVRLMQRAAGASGRPEALAPVEAWAHSQGVDIRNPVR
jgi:Tfp pilus assembly protein PilF